MAAALLLAAPAVLCGQVPADDPEHPEARLAEARAAVAALASDAGRGEKAEAYNSLGLQHWSMSRFDSALVHLRRAQSLWAEAGDTAGLGRAYNNIGVTYYQWGHYEPALEYFERSLELRRLSSDLRGRALVLSNIGNTLRDLQLYDRAVPVLDAAVASADTLGQPAVRGYALHNLGLLHMAMGNYPEARARLEESIAAYHSPDDPRLTSRDVLSGWSLNAVHLGMIHVLEGNVAEGIALLEEVRSTARAADHTRREAMALLHLGRAYRMTGNLRAAESSLERALVLATETEQRTIALDVLAALADTHESRGNTEQALASLRAHQALRDSVFSQHAVQRIAAADARAEVERQELVNARLQAEQRESEAVIVRQRAMGIMGGALLIMSLILVGVLVRFNRTGRERARLLSRTNTALAETNRELRVALSEVRTLKGLIPICASCKKVRDDEGFWEGVETYISNRSDALFSHSICTECGPVIYGSDWTGEPDPVQSDGG